jgi:predicted secreted hydrolase
VIKVVPPAPSEEERKRLAEEKARASSDAQLMRLYSTQEDIDRALQRKLAEIEGLIAIANGNKQSLRSQQTSLQSQAAEIERSGREVPADLIVKIDNLKLEQAQLDNDIARYEAVGREAEASFVADRARLGELLKRYQ